MPGCNNYVKRSKNAIYLSPGSTIRHEMSKCLGAYMLKKWGDIKFSIHVIHLLKELEMQVKKDMEGFPIENKSFITEAVPTKEKERRVDLVRLEDDQRFEFETSKKIKKDNACTIYI